MGELKDRKEVADELRKDIEKLNVYVRWKLIPDLHANMDVTRDLKFVQTTLNEIESQSKILLVLFKNLNQKKILACI
jgi:hypothetical protein